MKAWYYSNNGQQAGPVSEEQLRGLLANGLIQGSTLVWSEGMADWRPAAEALGLETGEAFAPPPPQPSAFRMSPVQAPNGAGPVPTHLAPAILATLLCCLPLGIPAIVFAAQASSANSSGDYLHAAECAKKAAMWGWISFGAGFIVTLASFALGLFSALAEM